MSTTYTVTIRCCTSIGGRCDHCITDTRRMIPVYIGPCRDEAIGMMFEFGDREPVLKQESTDGIRQPEL